MSDLSPFHLGINRSQSSTPQADLYTCEPCGSSCQQMAESQTKECGDISFPSSLRTGSRRHIRPGSAAGGRLDSDCLLLRPFTSGAASFFSCVQQSSYQQLPAVPVEPSLSCQTYSSSNHLRQASNRLCHNNDQSTSSNYPQPRQETTTLSVFPKPIYSYSILIFMALKNSKTGSLPVNEIYSFMTEHFPYFKTAPDGWKNSVRHNLSLNKCFVKIENKNCSSSRKGCLWSLNPAKVEKMQDELHKWRRKDPITVRRSMARPEFLDRLLGERPGKFRPAYNKAALLPKVCPAFSTTPSSHTPAQLQPPCLNPPHPHAHNQPQQACNPTRAFAHSNPPYMLYSPCEQPAATGSLNSPMAGKMPPGYDGTQQAGHSVGARSMQDFLMGGYAGYDIDMFNPSLTDLQGNFWEELQDDSLVSDPQVSNSLQDTNSPVYQTKIEYESRVTDHAPHLEEHGCLDGFQPVVYSGVESPAGYFTSCTTSISLM